MRKPTKAFADMMTELADKLDAVLVEIYPDAALHGVARGQLCASPDWLRSKAAEYAQIADARDATEALTEFLASYWYTPPVNELALRSAREEAVALLEKFDIRPKAATA